jgi:hypothetical protein
MNNKEFDKIIKSSLKNMSSKGKPNWNRMERHVEEWEMKEGFISDENFDKTIAEKLEEVKVEYDQSSWPKLEAKMLLRRSLRKRIIYYQMAGVAVILLLFALFFQLDPGKFNPYKNDISVEPASEMQEREMVGAVQQSSEKDGFDSEDTQVLSVDGDTELVDEQLFVQNSSAEPNVANAEEQNHLAFEPASTALVKIGQVEQSPVVDQSAMFEGEEERRVKSLAEPSRVNDSRGLNDTRIAEQWSSNEGTIYMDKLDHAARYCLADQNSPFSAMELTEPKYSSGQLPDKSHQKPKTWNLATYGQPQYLFLNSPYDALMKEPGYSRSWGTVGLGLGLHYRLGDWAFGMGMEYARFTYSPRKIEERLEGSDALIHLASISGDMLSLPIQVKYYWKDAGRFSFYSSLALSFRVAMATDYEIHRSEQGLTDLIRDLRTNPVYQNTLYSQKEYEPGLIEGGNARQQILTGVELACGIHYKIDDRFALFAEPAFRYDLSTQGFGPNQDKIHQLSLRAGVIGVLN